MTIAFAWYDGLYILVIVGIVLALFHGPIVAAWLRWRKRRSQNGIFKPEDLERYRKRRDEEDGE